MLYTDQARKLFDWCDCCTYVGDYCNCCTFTNQEIIDIPKRYVNALVHHIPILEIYVGHTYAGDWYNCCTFTNQEIIHNTKHCGNVLVHGVAILETKNN